MDEQKPEATPEIRPDTPRGDLRARLDKLESLFQQALTRIDQLESELEDTQEGLENLKRNQITDLETDLESLRDDHKKLGVLVDDIADEWRDGLTNYNKFVARYETEKTELEERIETVETEMQDQINVVAGKVTDLEKA